MNTYKVYAMVDASGRITAINSNAFLPNVEGWTEIDAGIGDKYHHAQNNYLPTPLMDEQGIYCYKLDGGKVVQRTQAEMDADIATPTPTEQEQLAARLDEVEAALIELAALTSEEA